MTKAEGARRATTGMTRHRSQTTRQQSYLLVDVNDDVI